MCSQKFLISKHKIVSRETVEKESFQRAWLAFEDYSGDRSQMKTTGAVIPTE
jgi:uncharacterized protein YecT (DUF1311 family)